MSQLKNKIFLINDTSLNQHHGCKLLSQTLKKILKSKKLYISNQSYNNEKYHSIVNKLLKADFNLIIINGEGTLHDKNNYSDVIFKIIEFADKNIKVPIIIINSVIQNLPRKNLKILKKCRKIFVRESNSFNYLNKNKIKSKLVPDILMFMDIKKLKNFSKKILVMDSTVINQRDKLFELSNIYNYDFIPIMKRHDFKFFFNFLNFLRYYSGYFKNLISIFFKKKRINYFDFYENDTEKFIRKFASYNFIITGRFHAVILCLLLEIPFFTFPSNTYKIEGLLKDIKISNRLKNLNSFKVKAKTIEKFNKIEIKKIKKYRKISKFKINKMFDEINLVIKNDKKLYS